MNAIKIYRLANWTYRKKIPVLPKLLKYLIYLIYNSVIPYSCKIGHESKFAYGGIGVVLHSKCKIGNKVILGQGITIGRQLSPAGVPQIGNNIYIAAGSRILGDITIRNNVIVGANSVVISSVLDNSIVAGCPAKVIRKIDSDIYELLGNIY